MRPVGWRFESHRHALAAKGIMTRKYMMPIVEETTVPIIDYPEEFHSIRQKSVVKMSPDEFLRLARQTGENRPGRVPYSQEEYERIIRQESKIARVKMGLQEGKDIPAGYIEFPPKGNIPIGHEGRHRAIAARELGLKEIPVVLVRERGQMRDGGWVYGEDEVVPMEGFPKYKDIRRRVLPFKYDVRKGGSWHRSLNMRTGEARI
jgi:hypothetical protein